MEDDQPINQLFNITSVLAPVQREELRQQLITTVNHLLVHDFGRLVQILYRVDVNEFTLRRLLQEQPGTDAAEIIANLLLERQEQKIRTRQSFRPGDNIPEEDKW